MAGSLRKMANHRRSLTALVLGAVFTGGALVWPAARSGPAALIHPELPYDEPGCPRPCVRSLRKIEQLQGELLHVTYSPDGRWIYTVELVFTVEPGQHFPKEWEYRVARRPGGGGPREVIYLSRWPVERLVFLGEEPILFGAKIQEGAEASFDSFPRGDTLYRLRQGRPEPLSPAGRVAWVQTSRSSRWMVYGLSTAGAALQVLALGVGGTPRTLPAGRGLLGVSDGGMALLASRGGDATELADLNLGTISSTVWPEIDPAQGPFGLVGVCGEDLLWGSSSTRSAPGEREPLRRLWMVRPDGREPRLLHASPWSLRADDEARCEATVEVLEQGGLAVFSLFDPRTGARRELASLAGPAWAFRPVLSPDRSGLLLVTRDLLDHLFPKNPDLIAGSSLSGAADVERRPTRSEALQGQIAALAGVPPERVTLEVFGFGEIKAVVHLQAQPAESAEDLRLRCAALEQRLFLQPFPRVSVRVQAAAASHR